LQTKDSKIAELSSQFKDLVREFQFHYEKLMGQDAFIKQLRIQGESVRSEQDAIEYRCALNNQSAARSMDRISSLQKQEESFKQKIYNVKGLLMGLELERNKLRNTKISNPSTSNESEIIALREQLSNLRQRKAMALQLVQNVEKECQVQVMKAGEETEQAKSKAEQTSEIYKTRSNELRSAIRTIERNLSNDLLEIENSRIAILREYESESKLEGRLEATIAKMKGKLHGLESEIAGLESEAEQERAVEEDRRFFIQNIKERLDERSRSAQSDMDRLRSLVSTGKLELRQLASELASVKSRVVGLDEQIEDVATGMDRKPDFQAILETDKIQLNRVFAKKARKQLVAQKKIECQQAAITGQINRQRKRNEELIAAITKCTQESRKRAEFSRKQRKRSKLIGVELKSLEAELAVFERDGLIADDNFGSRDSPRLDIGFGAQRNARAPPPLLPVSPMSRKPKKSPNARVDLIEIDRLTTELQNLRVVFDNEQKEMGVLCAEEEELMAELERLSMENQRLTRDLTSFDEVKTYWQTLNASVKPSGKKSSARKV
jgi:chromosome segregation ATPase